MLAALVVMVLAAAFALVIAGAVRSVHITETADASGWRARSLAREALSAVGDAVRWRPGAHVGADAGGGPGESWRASWGPAIPRAGDRWLRLRVVVESAYGNARSRDHVGLELRAEPWASGVAIAADADVRAPLVVSGSGVYVGGCLSGRENVGFACGDGPATPGGAAADLVRGDVFTEAAVHAGTGIFAHGLEIHDSADASLWPFDSDPDAGAPVSADWLTPPSARFLTAAAGHLLPPGEALTGDRLRLESLLPPLADAETVAGGWCVVTPAIDRVVISGQAPAGARLLIVVPGTRWSATPAVRRHSGARSSCAAGSRSAASCTSRGAFTRPAS